MARRINSRERKAINSRIHDIVSPGNQTRYFSAIPLEDLFNVVRAVDLEPLQEDNTPWDGFLCGASGQCHFPLGDASQIGHRPVGSLETLQEVKGGALQLSWYKMPSGRYEIVAYVM